MKAGLISNSAVAPNIFATEDVSIGTGDRNARRVQSLQVLIKIIRSYSAEILRLTLLFLTASSFLRRSCRRAAPAKSSRGCFVTPPGHVRNEPSPDEGARRREPWLLQTSAHEIACRCDYRCRKSHALSPCSPNPWRQIGIFGSRWIHTRECRSTSRRFTDTIASDRGYAASFDRIWAVLRNSWPSQRTTWCHLANSLHLDERELSGVTKFITLIPEK